VRLHEFEHSPKNTPESNLVTALELIRTRQKDAGKDPKFNTNSLIKLVTNTDHTFDYNALIAANKDNPAVKNLIKSIDQKHVVLKNPGVDDDNDGKTDTADNVIPPPPEEDADSMAPVDIAPPGVNDTNPAMLGSPETQSNEPPPVNQVDLMAKRAAAQRGAPISYNASGR